MIFLFQNHSDEIGYLTQQEEDTIKLLVTISGSLSFVSSLFIIISYLAFKETRHFHLRLILYLSLCDFGSSFMVLILFKTELFFSNFKNKKK